MFRRVLLTSIYFFNLQLFHECAELSTFLKASCISDLRVFIFCFTSLIVRFEPACLFLATEVDPFNTKVAPLKLNWIEYHSVLAFL